jgi:hypothetical protein
MMRGEIKIPGDWKAADREVEKMFEESINNAFDRSDVSGQRCSPWPLNPGSDGIDRNASKFYFR